ncbi:MAG: methyltransferase domain-containing protein [Actinophytocola sp.]|nr:methyltransferase domain-containing protein [Actinophytocola sp.]
MNTSRDSYSAAASAWQRGPAKVYDQLAEVLVDTCPGMLPGCRVLDLGAGTGAVSRAASARGATVVAADAAWGMLTADRHHRPPCVVADVGGLPFIGEVFDAVLASFVFNHVAHPVDGLAEAVRVTRPGGWVLASSFDADWTHPVKDVVDAVAARYGYAEPGWYTDLKTATSIAFGTTGAIADTLRKAGLVDVEVAERTVEIELRGAAELVAWRLGMAHMAPFVATLSPATQGRLTRDATTAVGPEPTPLRPVVLLARGRRPR